MTDMNPCLLRTKRATGLFGALIRKWTVDADERPQGTYEGTDRYVVSRADFRAALYQAGLRDAEHIEADGSNDEPDFALREGVTEIELIDRSASRFSILLPEPSMLTQIEDQANGDNGPVKVNLPKLYLEVDMSGPEPSAENFNPASSEFGDANYSVTLGENPFETFLDPHLAGYTCTQCR